MRINRRSLADALRHREVDLLVHGAALFVALASCAALLGLADARESRQSETLERAFATKALDFESVRQSCLPPLGTIFAGGALYGILDCPRNKRRPGTSRWILVLDTGERVIGGYDLGAYSKTARIEGQSVVFLPGRDHGAIRFTPKGPVYATLLDGREVHFVEPQARGGAPETLYAGSAPGRQSEAPAGPPGQGRWSKWALLHTLTEAGVTGLDRDPIASDGDFLLKHVGDISIGGRCYRNYFYVWDQVQVGEGGRIIHFWNQTREEGAGFTLHESRRLIVFDCGGGYLGAYGNLDDEPTGVSGASVFFGCHPDSTRCSPADGSAITFGPGGPPLHPSVSGETLSLSR